MKDVDGNLHYGKVRKLMPIECWRLQGFSDEQFHKAAATGLSDAQLYKMAGNAVTVPVISALGEKIKEIFGGTWLSDYVPNRLGGFESFPSEEPTETEDMDGGLSIK